MRHPSYSLSFEEFRSLAARGNLIPLYREILADFETPVSAFTKINHGPSAYLLESVEGERTGLAIRSSAVAPRLSSWRSAGSSSSRGAPESSAFR